MYILRWRVQCSEDKQYNKACVNEECVVWAMPTPQLVEVNVDCDLAVKLNWCEANAGRLRGVCRETSSANNR